jgi:xylan 1,4-beta-xylosidase
MIRLLIAAILLCSSPVLAAQRGQEAVFSYFDYEGQDPAAANARVGYNQYRNPIIPGFYPDPSIVRVGGYFYLVNSSFVFYPGLPIWRSSDLVSWIQIGNAIDRPGMFDFSGLGVARAIFAPTIRFHDGQFYIVNTCIECGFNFIISAKDPAGPWSNPVFLPSVDGIDLDLFFDDDGRVWIANNGPPIGTPKYDGHRALWIQEFDLKAMKMIGPRSMIVDGGVKPSDNPIWTEGPHIIKRDGWYYLIAAEGGTAGNHSQTVFRSRQVTGPFVPGPVNPILTQRDLDPKRRFPVSATGHADFVQTEKGDWWAAFLGTRPYRDNLSAMGRETFLLPIRWPKGGWPLILPPKTPVPLVVSRPKLPNTFRIDRHRYRDEFDHPPLSRDWVMLRTPNENWYSLATNPGSLTLSPRPVSLGAKGNPSFLGKRQEHANINVTTQLRYTLTSVGDRAGLAMFADEQSYYFLGLQQTSTGPAIVAVRRNGTGDPEDGRIIASIPYNATRGTAVRLSMRVQGGTMSFGYAVGNQTDRTLLANADTQHLASERSNQFTGAIVGLYAQQKAN